MHPQYREKTPFDAVALNVEPGHDEFAAEVYHDKIAAILDPIAESHLSGFSKVNSAQFQITNIEPHSSGVTTRVRYEIVGEANGFFREQRVGYWSIDWKPDSNNGYRVELWRQAEEEVRTHAANPYFADITRKAFGANRSYETQLLHGADYWRTVLDGASGIDIYGHNGVSVGDIDGDGLDDIYICQPAGLPNRLFRNKGGGTFEDITDASGLGLLDNTACALIADFDNDGRQDLVVVRANGPLLFLNRGNGKFELKPGAFQFANPPQGTFTGAAAADYNRDGRLDIYFCLYTFYQGADQYRYPTPYFAAENGPPNFLMHNNGDGTFRDVTKQCGLDKNNTRYSFCCAWNDYNNDGWPDLYVVNDFGRKNLYRNNGDSTFTDVAKEEGVEDVGAGMSVSWFGDHLYVANMWTAAGERVTSDPAFQKDAPKEIQALYRKHAMGNSLFERDPNSKFRDITAQSRTGMGRWSWSSDAWDFDHDGFPDIYITNGMITGDTQPDLNSFFWRQVVAKSPNTAKTDPDYEQGWNAINELIRNGYSWSGRERNVLYKNNRDGTFSDISGAVGLDLVEDGRAFALADFDGDGRQEILIKNRNAPQIRLMKNVIADLPPAISFRLEGKKSNRDAVGAAVTIEIDGARQTKTIQAGSGFLSQHSKDVFFGLGNAKGLVAATIRWPSGLVQECKNLPQNHRVWVSEGIEPARFEPFKQTNYRPDPTTPDSEELIPDHIETWLLAPVSTPSALPGNPVLLCFESGSKISVRTFDGQFQQPSITQDTAAVYNLLFRYIFDRHKDLPLPTSFLIDERGQIVKIYQGPIDFARAKEDSRSIPRTEAERLSKALPFPGISTHYEFGRNYLSLGSMFFQRGYMDASRGFFESAWKQDKDSAEACYGIGSVYLKQGEISQAREFFEKAVKLEASYPDTAPNAWNNLGLLAARAGETSKAIGYFQEALRFNPDHFVALENLGNAYRQEKRLDEARTTLERALAIKPNDAETNYSMAMVYAQLNDANSAYDYLQNALKARPTYPEALNNLGILYLRTQRENEAVASFKKCIEVAPEFDQAYINLARVYAIEGDATQARSILQSLLTRHPDNTQAQETLQQLGK